MKPETFVDYFALQQQSIMEGWVSGASFENTVQVRMDVIIRTHLKNRVQSTTPGGIQGLLQTHGKHAVPNIPTNVVPYQKWATMREIRYDRSTKISDFKIQNDRFIQYSDPSESYLLYKSTSYWIEIKVESPGTEGSRDFGGSTPITAFNDDIAKLRRQKAHDESQTADISNDITRRRYWFIMLAFSPERRGLLKSWDTEWSISKEFVHEFGTMLVALKAL